MTKRAELEQLQATIKEKFGALNGIIHSAGVIRDAFIVKKTSEDMHAVLAPKIQGTLNVDEVWQAEPLDFFVLFSSTAATLGNIGQIDYAYANGFMDGYARRRGALCKANQRQGKSIAINWPLWAAGGMQINEASEALSKQLLGGNPLTTEEGIDAFLAALSKRITKSLSSQAAKRSLLGCLSKLPVKKYRRLLWK